MEMKGLMKRRKPLLLVVVNQKRRISDEIQREFVTNDQSMEVMSGLRDVSIFVLVSST